MQSDCPKQYMDLGGMPVLRRTLNVFKKIDSITTLQCVISKGHEELYQQAVDGLDIAPYVYGGATRQDSVYNGLMALANENPDIVLIHDAARPFIHPQDIHNIIHTLDSASCATLAMPITETMTRGDGTIIPRDDAWIIQTPQAFAYETIVKAHEKAKADTFEATDDASIARHAGHDVPYVPCGRHNIKITTQDDLKMAYNMLEKPMETRIGNGFDVHAFNEEPSEFIRLCGVDIPYDRSLMGHSDADVGLHAITDAIFGAMADGDIGSHFPPSDMSFKNMDSHVFLNKSVENLKTRGGKIKHIDVTFMCEKPKIGKHREEIRDHLAKHLNLSIGRISVKATTTEKLGFTGREEGIACQAIVTIEVPNED